MKKVIKQKLNNDCVACVAAMITGYIKYDLASEWKVHDNLCFDSDYKNLFNVFDKCHSIAEKLLTT